MKSKLLPIALLGCLFLLGCPDPGPSLPTFTLNKPFDLAHGKTIKLADKTLTIRFDQVTGDSRCPAGVQCIWAGRADASFTLTQGSSTQSATLSTGDLGQGGSGSVSFGGYTIALLGIAPAKTAGQEVAQEEYVATLRVGEAGY